MSVRPRRRLRRISAVTGAVAIAASTGLFGAAASAAPVPIQIFQAEIGETVGDTQVSVVPSDIASSRPATAEGWWSDLTNASFDVTKLGPGNDPALSLDLINTTSRSYVYRSFPADSRPTDLNALRAGASYTYAGTNVNFQFEVLFKPEDPTYGPNPTAAGSPGDSYCDSANAWGFTDVPADWCYTVIKWEPLDTSQGGWSTVDLTADTAVDSSIGRGGWRTQKRIGIYAKAGAFAGSGTFTQYLDQIEEYVVTAIVVGAGSGTAGPVSGFVKNITVGGVSYDFAPEPAEPSDPPAEDSDELEQLIENQDIDVEELTAQFVPTGATNTDLDAIDPSRPMNGRYEDWEDPTDAFADVYSYSAATYLGAFPIVDGHVMLTGADLSHLTPGTHHLFFRGQTSGAVAIVRIQVIAPAAADDGAGLPATGFESGPLPGVGIALLAAGVLLAALRRRQGAQPEIGPEPGRR